MIDVFNNVYNLFTISYLNLSADNYTGAGRWGIKRLRVTKKYFASDFSQNSNRYPQVQIYHLQLCRIYEQSLMQEMLMDYIFLTQLHLSLVVKHLLFPPIEPV